MTDEVIDAATMCMVAQADEAVSFTCFDNMIYLSSPKTTNRTLKSWNV